MAPDYIIPPKECYQHLGFKEFDEAGEFVEAGLWRSVQETKELEKIRSRYLLRRDRVNQPIVHEGYIIGRVTANSLLPHEVERMLSGLTEGIAAGCVTVREWQEYKAARRRKD